MYCQDSVSVAATPPSATFLARPGPLVPNQSPPYPATLNGSSAAATISLVAPAAPITLSSLQCNPPSLPSNASTPCTVILSKSTTSTTHVALSNSASTLMTVPSSATHAPTPTPPPSPPPTAPLP